MLIAQSMYHAPPRGLHTSLIKRITDVLHQHQRVREIVAYGDEGELIGRVIARVRCFWGGAGSSALDERTEYPGLKTGVRVSS